MRMQQLFSETKDMPLSNEPSARYVNILLTRYPDFASKLFGVVTGGRFTHASVGLSDTDGAFYSFVTTGFRIEAPKEHPTFKSAEVPCGLYRIPVSEETYLRAKSILEVYVRQTVRYKYTRVGLLLSIFRVIHKCSNRYFCSQFVSEILESAEVIRLEKHSSLYLPDDFRKMKELECCFEGTLRGLIDMASDHRMVASSAS